MRKKLKRPSCSDCLRPVQYCYCHKITTVNNRWPVYIIQHKLEAKHPLGTARIAALSLTDCQFIQDGEINNAFTSLPVENKPLLVYPDKDATDITEVEKSSIRPLLFIDASWKKSRRLLYENPVLQGLDKLTIHPSAPSRYRIRKAPKADCLSTLESIVYGLSTLEENQRKYQGLLQTMDYLIQQQISRMGEDVYAKNYSNA